MGRAGLRSSDGPSHNTVVSGHNVAGSGGQKEIDSYQLLFRPGILRVLRSSPRAEPGVVSAPEQRGAGPGQSVLSGNTLLQAERGQGEPGRGLDQTAEVVPPVLGRGSRQKFKISPY